MRRRFYNQLTKKETGGYIIAYYRPQTVGSGVRILGADFSPTGKMYAQYDDGDISEIKFTSSNGVFATFKSEGNQYGEHKVKFLFDQPQLYTNDMFNDCDRLTDIDLSNFNFSHVVLSSSMFYATTELTGEFDMPIDTRSLIDCNSMFAYSGIISISLAGLDMSKTDSIGSMFENSEVRTVTFPIKEMSSLKYSENVFKDCHHIKTINNIKNAIRSNTQDIHGLFQSCYDLTSIDLNGCDTSGIINAESAFMDCKLIEDIWMGNCDLSKLKYADNMFSGCDELRVLSIEGNVPSLERANTSNMFDGVYTSGTLYYKRKYYPEVIISRLPTKWIDLSN